MDCCVQLALSTNWKRLKQPSAVERTAASLLKVEVFLNCMHACAWGVQVDFLFHVISRVIPNKTLSMCFHLPSYPESLCISYILWVYLCPFFSVAMQIALCKCCNAKDLWIRERTTIGRLGFLQWHFCEWGPFESTLACDIETWGYAANWFSEMDLQLRTSSEPSKKASKGWGLRSIKGR